MSASQSLYRKYRSQSFDELVGQEPVVRTLKNAIASDRIAHAYLFTGPRGVGKTSAARLVARAANCTAPADQRPCNQCPNCLAATRDIATDLIEIDAASNTGVDNIREVIERANFAPSIWHTKFYIIDEVHMLSVSAFNALLKTLEEPPAHTSFILATTEVHKVPATVASRCQRFDFRRIPLKAMLDRLQYICEQEGIKAQTAALELVARQATGSLRDALSLLDQLRVFSEDGSGITLAEVQDMLGAGGSEEVAAFVDTLIQRDLAGGLRRINAALEEGIDLRQFNRQVVEHLRGLMLVKTGAAQADAGLLDVTDEGKTRLQKQAEGVSIPDLLHWIKCFGDADSALKGSVYGQLPLEMAFIAASLPPQLTVPQSSPVTPPQRDRAAELKAASEDVGAPPAQRPSPQRRPEAAPSSAPPPPIHSELGSLSLNGNRGNGTSDHEVKAPDHSQPVQEVGPVEQRIDASSEEASAQPPADDLERLRSLWSDVVDQIRARSRMMAIAYANTASVRPVQVRNGIVVISFRDPIQAKRSSINEPSKPYRDIVETSLRRVLGYKVRVECITFAQEESGQWGEDAPSEGGGAKKQKPKQPSPYDSTRGKAAMNIFEIDRFDESE